MGADTRERSNVRITAGKMESHSQDPWTPMTTTAIQHPLSYEPLQAELGTLEPVYTVCPKQPCQQSRTHIQHPQ